MIKFLTKWIQLCYCLVVVNNEERMMMTISTKNNPVLSDKMRRCLRAYRSYLKGLEGLGLLDMVEWRSSLEELDLMIKETSRNEVPPSTISIVEQFDILNSDTFREFMRLVKPAFTKRDKRKRETICNGAERLEYRLFSTLKQIEERWQ